MKLNGKVIEAPKEHEVVFEREGDYIVFKIKPVLNFDPYSELNPPPEPPTKVVGDNPPVPDYTDKKFQKRMQDWNENKFRWMILEALSATPGLEWETVDMKNPETFKNFEEELKNSGLTDMEQQVLVREAVERNIITPESMREARDTFLALQSQTSGS